MSILFQNLRIVDVEYMPEEDDAKSTVQLGIESDCPFHLATTTAIPYVAEVIVQVDIPMHDGSSLAEAIEEARARAWSLAR